MKKVISICTLMLIAMMTNAQSNEATTINKFHDDFITSMLKGNVSFITYMDASVRLMPEYNMTVVTQANSRKYYESFLTAFDVISFSRTTSEIIDMGSYVLDWGTFTMKVTHRATSKQHDIPGKYMDLWKKGPSGKLLVVCQAWNYNQRVDIGDQLRFPSVPVTNIALAAHTQITNHTSFELAGMNELMESIVIQHDARLWKMFYTDDANFLYSNNPVYQGRQSLDAFLDEHVKGLPIFEKLDIRNDEVIDLGKYVIEYASHTAFVRGDNWSGTGTGKDLRIWRRENDCSLKIFRHIGMYD